MNLGIYILISNSQDFKEKNESDKNKITSDIFEKLSLSANKAEKDIGIYKSSISKMEQAKELIKELRIKDKKKNQKARQEEPYKKNLPPSRFGVRLLSWLDPCVFFLQIPAITNHENCGTAIKRTAQLLKKTMIDGQIGTDLKTRCSGARQHRRSGW